MGQLPRPGRQENPRPFRLQIGNHRFHCQREAAIADTERPVQRVAAAVEHEHDSRAGLDRTAEFSEQSIDQDVVRGLVGCGHVGHDGRNQARTTIAIDRAGHRQIDDDHVVARTARPGLADGRHEGIDDFFSMTRLNVVAGVVPGDRGGAEDPAADRQPLQEFAVLLRKRHRAERRRVGGGEADDQRDAMLDREQHPDQRHEKGQRRERRPDATKEKPRQLFAVSQRPRRATPGNPAPRRWRRGTDALDRPVGGSPPGRTDVRCFRLLLVGGHALCGSVRATDCSRFRLHSPNDASHRVQPDLHGRPGADHREARINLYLVGLVRG